MTNKKYYIGLDIIRIISCIGVLLYHMGYLKGGFLAVCTFFVLTGYLSCVSSFNKEKFSILSYYKNRLLQIYLPFVCVVFLSIFVINLIPSINWLNLKPETLSVLGGYNNYWQLSANMDYFARHVSSPFMHFWYIAILLQFELIFPILFLLFKKIGDKTKGIFPIVVTTLLTGVSTAYFYYMSTKDNIMVTYYDTLCRIFSICFGLLIGWIHAYYHSFKVFKGKIITKIIFTIYLILLIGMFFIVDSNSSYFNIAMIAATYISCRLITYGTINSIDSFGLRDKALKNIASISYEIYLVQYPIIFLFQNIELDERIKVLCMIPLIIVISYFLHFILNFKKDRKLKIIRTIFLLITLVPVGIGIYQFVITKDHTQEMKELEEQLSENQELMKSKQDEYARKLVEEQEKWNNALEEFEMDESKLSEMIHGLPVVGVGDSVMLGAVPTLYQTFPNGYFDAAVSRTDYEASGILQGVKNKGMLGDPIIINLGTNGQCGRTCQNDILRIVENRKVFWINVTNDRDVHVNAGFNALAKDYSNVTVIDWMSASSGHPEYFIADGIHLTGTGMKAYSDTIYNSIYNVYYDYYKNKKDEILKQRKEELDKKINFYGNEVLLNAYSNILNKFDTAVFHTNKELTYELLKSDIEEDINSSNLPYRNVIMLDYSFNLAEEEYLELVNLSKEHYFYIVDLNGNNYPQVDNVTIIDYKKELDNHNDYLMPDREHLSTKGNKALVKLLYNEIYKDKFK